MTTVTVNTPPNRQRCTMGAPAPGMLEFLPSD